jgi:hypothetical protein
MNTSQNLQENPLVLSRSLQMPSRAFRRKTPLLQCSRIIQDGLLNTCSDKVDNSQLVFRTV